MLENSQILMLKMSPEQLKVFNEFSSTYELEKSLRGDENIIHRDSQMKCRFCRRTNNQVKFNKAHIIPQLLGKAQPTSKFECKECNDIFSGYETDLGHYLLIDRAMLGQPKKKSGKPKYKDNGFSIKNLTTVPDHLQGIDEAIMLQELLDADEKVTLLYNNSFDTNKFKRTDNELDVTLNIKPYIPFNIFRVFAKIGLLLLDENEMSDYSIVKNLLHPNFKIPQEYDYTSDIFRMCTISIPLFANLFPSPIVYIYKRKIDSRHVKRIFVLFFGSKIFQIPLFSDIEIQEIDNGTTKQLIPTSPFINPYSQYISELPDHIYTAIASSGNTWTNLYSTTLKKNDTHNLRFTKNEDI